MPIKTITLPSGKTVRFGRRHPVARFKHLQLRNYLRLPAPPPAVDYSGGAVASLGQMYDNDTLGDCVIAAVEHAEGVFTGSVNNPAGGIVFPHTTTIANYSNACGYVQNDPNTDQGCDIQTVLGYWEQTGIGGGSDIVGVMVVDPTNVVEVQTAIYLFENLIIGLDLPDAWVNPFPSANGFVWDVAGPPDQMNGHCVPCLGYNANQVMISTWGMTGFITNAAFAEYVNPNVFGECYVVLSQDIINQATLLSPDGLDWAQLQADFAVIGGAPTPTPVPPPVPPIPPVPAPPAPPPPGPLPAGTVMVGGFTPEALVQMQQAMWGGFVPGFAPGGGGFAPGGGGFAPGGGGFGPPHQSPDLPGWGGHFRGPFRRR